MRDLPISYGNSCHARFWSNKTIEWNELCKKLKTTIRTNRDCRRVFEDEEKRQGEAAKDKGALSRGTLGKTGARPTP